MNELAQGVFDRSGDDVANAPASFTNGFVSFSQAIPVFPTITSGNSFCHTVTKSLP